MKWNYVILLFFFCSCRTNSSKDESVNEKFAVVPGVGMKTIKIGDAWSQDKKYFQHDVNSIGVRLKNNQVVRIIIDNPKFFIKNTDLSVGSSLQAFLTEFKFAKKNVSGKSEFILPVWSIPGLSITLNEDESLIVTITIYAVGADVDIYTYDTAIYFSENGTISSGDPFR